MKGDPTRHLRRNTAAVILILAFWARAPIRAQDIVPAWTRWETKLTGSFNYAVNSGNPYKDLKINVSFSCPGYSSYTGYGFWDGEENVGGILKSVFKIRSAFPPASTPCSWSSTCTGSAGGFNCATDTGLAKSGTVAITKVGWALGAGLPKVAPNGNYLLFANDSKFFWLADTAWTATAEATLANWQSYVDNRANKGFTVVLMSPAPAWPDHGLLSALNYSFRQVTSACGNSNLPNDCSTWIPAYWQKVDALVQYANQKGLVVVMVGLIDPLTIYEWPALNPATTFARNLAARLAGDFVIFSPGFDTLVNATPATEATMNSAGDILNGIAGTPGAVPRHLVGNHLGGGSSYADYGKFHGKAWLDLHPFQSGHGKNGCSGISVWQCAIKRAREMPLTLSGFGPVKPRTNAEGPYDLTPGVDGTPPDNRYGMRQAGYVTTLSGAFGFTNGVHQIAVWNNPLSNLNHPSTQDVQRLGERFKAAPWYDLKPQHGWINNQAAAEEQKMVLAVTGNNSFALAYMPNNDTLEIKNGATGLSGLTCSAPWTIKWYNPRNSNDTTQGTCSVGTGVVTLRRPGCPSTGDGVLGRCDWSVELRNNNLPLPATTKSAATAVEMTVWSAPSGEDVTTSIRAILGGRDGSPISSEIEVSSAGKAIQRLPIVSPDAQGNFWVVWEAESLDGNQSEVFARRFSPLGLPLGEAFQVHQTTEGNQYEPAIAADDLRTVMIAWTSYEQDGEAGGIVLRRFDLSGAALGDEVLVTEGGAGHQHSPRLAVSRGGGLVVAWEDGREGEGQTIGFQRFNPLGKPVGLPLHSRPGPGRRDQYLIALRIGMAEDLGLELAEYDDRGNHLGYSLQRFD